jgi:hypothetical protein
MPCTLLNTTNHTTIPSSRGMTQLKMSPLVPIGELHGKPLS